MEQKDCFSDIKGFYLNFKKEKNRTNGLQCSSIRSIFTCKTFALLQISSLSPKYARYQKRIRDAQVERAEKILDSGKANYFFSFQRPPL